MRQVLSVANKVLDYLNDSMEMDKKIAVECRHVCREVDAYGTFCLRTETSIRYIHSINVGELWDDELPNIKVYTTPNPETGINAIEFVYQLINALKEAQDKYPDLYFIIDDNEYAPYGVTWGLWNDEKEVNEAIIIEVLK